MIPLKACYWVGAAADAVVAVGMVYPSLLAAALGIDPPPASVEVRSALGMGAALMSGWTALLLWASRRPVERRGVLALTVFPVVVGLALTTLYAYGAGYVPPHGALSVWTFQTILGATFLAGYKHASRLALEA